MDPIKTLDFEQTFKCEVNNCQNEATEIVYTRHKDNKILFMCREHKVEAQEEERPEYWEGCPNCGCQYGVN